MLWFYNGLIDFWMVLNFSTCAFFLYQLAVGVVALRHVRPAPVQAHTRHRFAALIAARNEEGVIARLIESVRAQDYPAELIDVIVVADNCTDRTADAARKAGAIVYAEIGKGFVLRFAFEHIFAERDVYDAFCIFDADNLVDGQFFNEMNAALCAGAKVAQGYRDIKNPHDTWISGSHAIYYWMQNRFSNFARACMGLSASINGTGFMISAAHLRQHGYRTYTLTEDLEYTMQTVMLGERVEWVPCARIYDEQPLTQSQSMIPRSRWTTGFMQCLKRYFSPMMQSFLSDPNFIKFDMILFLLTLPITLIGTASTFLSFFLTLLGVLPMTGSFINTVALIFGILGGFMAVAWLTVRLEKPRERKALRRAILAYPYFNLTWMVIYLKCFFVRSNAWKAIPHVRSVGIRDMEIGGK